MDTIERFVQNAIGMLQLTPEKIRDTNGNLKISRSDGGMLLAFASGYSDVDKLRVINRADDVLAKKALKALNVDAREYGAQSLLILATAGALFALIAEKLSARP